MVRERCRNVQGMVRERCGNVRGTVREAAGRLQGRCGNTAGRLAPLFFSFICTEFYSFGKCHFLKTEVLQGGKGSFASSADSKILRKNLGAVKTFLPGLFCVESSANAFHNDFWFGELLTINRTAAEIQMRDPFQRGERWETIPRPKHVPREALGLGGRGHLCLASTAGAQQCCCEAPLGSSPTTAVPAKFWKEVSTSGEFPGRVFISC